MNTPAHLGGHCQQTHIDPLVFDYLIETFQIETMLDIGCGPGGMQALAQAKSIDWMGIDGDPVFADKVSSTFVLHDFTKGPIRWRRQFDLGWSVEFLEHVEEQYIPNYMSAFKRCTNIFATAAPEGSPGHHHVNCQNLPYWIEVFRDYGYTFLPDVTEECKRLSTMRKGFVKRGGMVFAKARSTSRSQRGRHPSQP